MGVLSLMIRAFASLTIIVLFNTIIIKSEESDRNNQQAHYNGNLLQTEEVLHDLRGDHYYWSQWSKWSSCSKSCGRGVSGQRRYCVSKIQKRSHLNGHLLNNTLTLIWNDSGNKQNNKEINRCGDGEKVRFKVCVINTNCSQSPDWRNDQCARYNRQSFNRKFHNWVPHSAPGDGDPETSECRVSCRPKVGRHYLSYTISSIADNGISCGVKGDRVCLAGVCESVGCDEIISSNPLVYDACGICGGNNITCQIIKGEYDMQFQNDEWNLIVRIPEGSMNITVSQTNVSKNRIGLRQADGQLFLDGRWSLNGWYNGAGSQFIYHEANHRVSDRVVSKSGKPIDQSLDILIYNNEPNVGIQYQYATKHNQISSIPSELRRASSKKLSFDSEPIESNKSTDPYDNEKSQYYSYETDKNELQQNDGTIKAIYQWQISDWNTCSVTCGSGIQTRHIQCILIDASNIRIPAHDSNCPKPMPSVVQNCQITANCDAKPLWKIFTEWGTCSVTCGKGIRRRSVCCFLDNIQVHDSRCDPKLKPACEEICDLGSCVTKLWMISQWSGKCSNECGFGIERRTVICYGGNDCDSRLKPDEERKCCSFRGCNRIKWFYTDWSDCSTNCGTGVETRDLLCLQYDRSKGWTIVNESECLKVLPKPETERICTSTYCASEWFISEWDQKCENDMQMRTVMCLNHKYQISHNCSRHDVPSSSTPCKLELCHENWNRVTNGISNPSPNNRNTKLPITTTMATTIVRPIDQPNDPKASKCEDKLPNCPLAKGANLCQYDYYRDICCKSCVMS